MPWIIPYENCPRCGYQHKLVFDSQDDSGSTAYEYICPVKKGRVIIMGHYAADEIPNMPPDAIKTKVYEDEPRL